MDINNLNILVLAYIGDSVYENYVRHFLVNKGFSNVESLQKESIKYVSAKAQASFLYDMMSKNVLSDSELSIYHRARNYKSNRHPKNTPVVTYKVATGFEAIIGYLDLTRNYDRLEYLINYILEGDLK